MCQQLPKINSQRQLCPAYRVISFAALTEPLCTAAAQDKEAAAPVAVAEPVKEKKSKVRAHAVRAVTAGSSGLHLAIKTNTITQHGALCVLNMASF